MNVRSSDREAKIERERKEQREGETVEDSVCWKCYIILYRGIHIHVFFVCVLMLHL